MMGVSVFLRALIFSHRVRILCDGIVFEGLPRIVGCLVQILGSSGLWERRLRLPREFLQIIDQASIKTRAGQNLSTLVAI